MALLLDVGVSGEALSDFGFQAHGTRYTTSGIGLVTFGFLWPSLWQPCNSVITTSWDACGATIISEWTECGAAPSTTWTECD